MILAASPGEPGHYFVPVLVVWALVFLSGIAVTRILRWRAPGGDTTLSAISVGRLLGVLSVGVSWLLVMPETRLVGVATVVVAALGYWWTYGRTASKRAASTRRSISTDPRRAHRQAGKRTRATSKSVARRTASAPCRGVDVAGHR